VKSEVGDGKAKRDKEQQENNIDGPGDASDVAVVVVDNAEIGSIASRRQDSKITGRTDFSSETNAYAYTRRASTKKEPSKRKEFRLKYCRFGNACRFKDNDKCKRDHTMYPTLDKWKAGLQAFADKDDASSSGSL